MFGGEQLVHLHNNEERQHLEQFLGCNDSKRPVIVDAFLDIPIPSSLCLHPKSEKTQEGIIKFPNQFNTDFEL